MRIALALRTRPVDDFSIDVTDDASAADRAIVENGLIAFNRMQAGNEGWRRLDLFLRDADGQIVGGLLAYTEWDWLFIEILWIEERLRGQRAGSALLARAEAAAVARNCHHAWLDTYSYQARGFYEKHGYSAFGTLDGYPPGGARYFMQKRGLDAG